MTNSSVPPAGFPAGYRVSDPHDPFELLSGIFYEPEDDSLPPVVAMVVEEKHCNRSGATHGGLLVTMADLALCARARWGMPNERVITVSIDASFVGAGRLGEFIVAETDLVRRTGSLAFVRCTIRAGDRVLLSASAVTKRVQRDRGGPSLQRPDYA